MTQKNAIVCRGSQQPTPMYSTQLCIVRRGMQAAKPYFIDLQKNWKPINLT